MTLRCGHYGGIRGGLLFGSGRGSIQSAADTSRASRLVFLEFPMTSE
jgi:hypothetical protein